MTAIYDLLTFPTISDAFTAYPTKTTGFVSPGDSGHPRKTPRLADDIDSASASRSRDAISTSESDGHPDNAQKTGPVVFNVVGAPYQPASLKGDFSDECYRLVMRFLRAFLARGTQDLPATYEAVYSACRTVVLFAGSGEALYDNVKITLEKCVGQLMEELLKEKQQGVKWIAPFVDICVWFDKRVGLLQSLLTYLDRVYLFQEKNILSIRPLAFRTFSNRIFGNPHIIKSLRSGLQEWLHWERENRMSHELRSDISRLITHLIAHDKYSSLFESFYVDMTESYYSEESCRIAIAMKSDPAEFMIHCITRVQEETHRSNDILLESSWELVRSTTERSLLQNQLRWVAMQGLPPLIETENISALADMYSSFTRIGHRDEVLKSFKAYVLLTVSRIVGDKERDDDMVSRLLEFKAFADKTVNTAFVDPVHVTTQDSSSSTSLSIQAESQIIPNREFAYGLMDAFQAGFKSRKNKPAEMIAKYLDKAMRKGQRDASDADFNAVLDNALALYRFTDDKDVFRAYYHRALAKRLLTSRSASDAFETSILKRLKEQYDPEFDMGESMFKDIALSRDLVSGFRDHKLKGKNKGKGREQMEEDDDLDSAGPKFTVMVLQQSVWPFSARKRNVDLPSYMLDQIIEFTEFYKLKHKGHVLSWDHSLGNASIVAQFKSGTKELLVSLYQAVVLVLFNDVDEMSFKDIKAMTSMDDADLRRTLQSLACTQKKVLRKRPAGRDVNDDDKFYYNANFTHPRHQVRIDSIQAKETVEEAKRTEAGIQTDRKFVIDAAIVRVMKARKERTFEQLKIDVVDAVKVHFVPDMKHFKERVDSLVEGEFLRRDEDNRDLFYYVA